ncbi:hypothetical protein ACFSTI_30450, partial [Rhizorhabdus histidinilytica]
GHDRGNAGRHLCHVCAGRPHLRRAGVKLGEGSTLGHRLRVLGAWLDNLRAGLQGRSGGAASIGAAAVQAASAPGAQPVTHGSARWGTVAEIRQAGHLVAPGKPAGFALGRAPMRPPASISVSALPATS